MLKSVGRVGGHLGGEQASGVDLTVFFELQRQERARVGADLRAIPVPSVVIVVNRLLELGFLVVAGIAKASVLPSTDMASASSFQT